MDSKDLDVSVKGEMKMKSLWLLLRMDVSSSPGQLL